MMKSISWAAMATALMVAGPAAPLLAQPSAGAESPVPGSADARLKALYEAEWDWRLEQEALLPSEEGRPIPAGHFPRVDAASQQQRLDYYTNVLAELSRIPRDQLSAEEKVNAEVFETMVEGFVADLRYKLYQAPFNADTFFWTSFTPRGGLEDADAYRRYLGRLKDVPRYFDEHIANMRAGLERGFTVPKVATIGRDKTIEPYLAADETNPLYTPFKQMPASMPEAEQARLRAEAKAVIASQAVPAYTELLGFMREEYLPNARTNISASSLPNGPAYYQAMIEKFTTLDLTAEEIHQIGLKEVARIKAEMEATKEEAGFDGTLAEFMHFLRTDPQFYAETPHELLADAAYWVKKADLKLGETIGFLPRFRHGIRPVPEALAPIYTGGRGGLESCLFNTYNLPARPLYTLSALALHECTPGHSFQAALALEGPERPAFRDNIYFSGYGEGWGLYTEWLGTVMGIYETPYQNFGRLTYLSEHEITTEVDRYIAWPGQALAYKLGELQIRRHRREAQEALGDKFDQRKFHDAILALGSVPLPVLEARIEQFIADGGENPPRPVVAP